MIKIKMIEPSEAAALMNAADYKNVVGV